MDDCDSNAEIVLSLKALRAKYREVELLMKSIDNADGVRTVLCQINVEFDRLMNMCCNIDENQTIPGSASHKIEVINSGNAFKDKVECWLLGTEMPVKCNISGDTGDVGVCSELHAENAVKVRCDDVGDKTCSSVGTSSRVSSSSSRLRKSRVKVQLARLALCHEKERLRENCEKATREKERQLEMAEAELEAWEAESVCSISRRSRTTSRSVHDVMPTTVAQPTPELACNNQAQKGLNLPTSNGKATLSPPYRCLTNSSSYPGAGKGQSVEHVSFMPAEPIVEGIGSQKRTRWDMPRGGGKSAGEMQSGAPGLGCSSEQKMCVTNQEPMPCHAGYAQQTSPSVEVSERYLPKPVIEEFDGDPLDYWAFVNRFKVHIADRIRSIDLKLVYLLQHCSRRVYDRIKHFASGPDKRHCYDMVWRELYDWYGQPHVIGRHCEERLLEVGKIGQHDSESLESLAILMKRCLAAMEEFSGFSTINTVGFIAALVDKLPLEMRRRWVSRALSLQADNGRLAGFADFAHFVIGEAAEANSIYYKAIFPYRPNIRGDGGGAKRPKAHAFAVSARSNVKTSADVKNIVRNNSKDDKLQCWHCGKSHKLEQCSEFIDLQYAEKKRVVRSKRLCYRCLRGGHVVKDCRSRLACSIESCKSTDHHTLLHLDPVQVEGSDVVCSAVSVRLRHVCLDIVPVRVSNGGVDVLTYALLDPGSSVSFCERVLIEKLGLCGDGNMVETCVETLTTEKPERLKSESFSLRVKSLDDTNAFCLDKVILIDQIPVGPDRRNLCDDIDGFEHLEGVTLPQIDKATVTLLIGNDNYLAQFPLETRLASNPESSPHAIRTPLGWVLKGPSLTTEQSSAGNSVSCLLSQGRVPECIEALRDSIVTDEGEVYDPSVGLGAADVENLMSWLRSNVQVQQFGMRYSAEDVVAYDLMNKSVAREEGHFRLPLLWRNDAVVLPESLTMAKKRLSAVKQRLKRDSNLKDMYCKEMQALLDEGYAEVVSSDQNVASSRVWYIPHHAVLNANKPGRVRVVYDCAARSHGTSLNENLMRGPDFVNSLMGVLLRFRKNRIAIVSDIKGMFHQVRCAPKDRDALRFLWYPEGNLEAEPVPHRMMIHLFGAKSSPSCAAFALLQTAKVYGKLYNPTVSDVVRKCFYVDDCLISVDSDEAGVRLVQDLSELLARGGFHLTKWVSTSEAVMKSVLFEDRAKSTCNLNLGAEVDERVLGMRWHMTSDTFGYQVRLPDKPITRRGLLSVSSSLFDPLGLESPVVLEARLLLRSLCQGAAVKAVIKDCLFCTRRSARPGAQIMADLPPARLQMHEAPFAHTGVDYFGPFVIKRRRSEIKRYGCIMTCMTTRAIHLEVAPDLSTSSFVNVLRRFVARRGTVTCLYSDNGTNFLGSERILRESIQAWNKQQIHEHLRQSGIKWFFNPPGASHMGGAWERMVGLVKGILGAIVPGKIMDDDTLHTLLLEVEAIVNSRPLTDVFVDGDTDLPLTPSHLLRINHSIGLPPMPTDKSDVYARRRYRLVQFAADEFWRRWILEYPRTLFPRRKWEERRENIRCGDVVLVVDTTSPRGEWPLGRVVELFPDKHGVVRIVNVKTKSGTLKRPITKLCVIVKADESDAGHKA